MHTCNNAGASHGGQIRDTFILSSKLVGLLSQLPHMDHGTFSGSHSDGVIIEAKYITAFQSCFKFISYFWTMKRVKVFVKTEVDLKNKVGAYAYTLYGYPDQFTKCKSFKKGIVTMTHADCMAVVNALHYLSVTIEALEVGRIDRRRKRGKAL